MQAVPLLAIPFVVVAYPGRHTHRRYLFYGVGFYALDKTEGHVVSFSAKVVILATGGASKVYL